MKINKSPWLHQLDKDRKIIKPDKDVETDVVVIGAGIAGISTAFFLLKNTDKCVVVVDKFRLAHGATGHNAGQVVTYFERPFHSIVKEFGEKKSADAQRSIEATWDDLSDMYTEANLSIPFARFMGYDGYTTYSQVLENLKDDLLRKRLGLPSHGTLISEHATFIDKLTPEYSEVYQIVGQSEVSRLLETEDPSFVAVSKEQKGVINSALFTQEIALYLGKQFGDRFTLYEDTTVNKAVLRSDSVILDTCNHEIRAEKVVLCTNGFENFSIFDARGLEIDSRFHEEVTGIVARMSGYLEKMNKQPTAISYYVEPEDGFANMEDPYFYLTRRMYEYEKGQEHNLICVGGPQHSIADREEYLYEFDYPEEVLKEIDEFVKKVYDADPNRKIEYQFTWHGLMGYTSNMIRIVGAEPENPNLLYNLGCNGVGILPSIFGGKRISQIIRGDKLEPMIFDPKYD